MKRRPTTQDITWFLDLHDNEKINLAPPYQRRSVWTRKDRIYFLDTIFKGYPCPAIFLHKVTDERGSATYHVVDGKQRLETIFLFANNRITMPNDFYEQSLAGKKFRALDPEFKHKFWNYILGVEMLDTVEPAVVDEIFDRLNRNSRKLERQELRHAKYDGWLINFAETQSELEEWKILCVTSASRAKRMKDVQFLSELLIYSIENEVQGFSQDEIDNYYAKYDLPSEDVPNFVTESFEAQFIETRNFLVEMEGYNNCISLYAKNAMHFYTLWNVIHTCLSNQTPNEVAESYLNFMSTYNNLSKESIAEAPAESQDLHIKYAVNSVGANTDLPQRKARFESLSTAIIDT